MTDAPTDAPTDAHSAGLLALVAASGQGVLATLKRDGRPQLSNISYHFAPDTALVRISVTAGRAKTRNAVRDPRVSLHVSRADFWAWTVVEGVARLSPVAAAPQDGTPDPGVEALVALYRDVAGEHPDWADYRRAMVADRRQVLSFTPDHVYGQLGG